MREEDSPWFQVRKALVDGGALIMDNMDVLWRATKRCPDIVASRPLDSKRASRLQKEISATGGVPPGGFIFLLNIADKTEYSTAQKSLRAYKGTKLAEVFNFSQLSAFGGLSPLAGNHASHAMRALIGQDSTIYHMDLESKASTVIVTNIDFDTEELSPEVQACIRHLKTIGCLDNTMRNNSEKMSFPDKIKFIHAAIESLPAPPNSKGKRTKSAIASLKTTVCASIEIEEKNWSQHLVLANKFGRLWTAISTLLETHKVKSVTYFKQMGNIPDEHLLKIVSRTPSFIPSRASRRRAPPASASSDSSGLQPAL
jgi:hypothetical protein